MQKHRKKNITQIKKITDFSYFFLCTDELIKLLPGWFSHLCIQAMAGTLGGFTTTIITNPLDIVRARLQVQRLDSMFSAFRILWIEEGLLMFTKGLSARLVQSACFSFSIILGYETIKRVSITEEYKSYIRWWAPELLLRLIFTWTEWRTFHPKSFIQSRRAVMYRIRIKKSES